MQALSKIVSTALTLLLVACLVYSTVPASAAWAEEEVTADTPMPNIAELQKQVDEAAATYDDATQRITELEKEITAYNERITALQLEIPQARKISNDYAREYYLMLSTANPYLEMILSAKSLEDFFTQIEYTLRVNESYLTKITSLSTLTAELEEARAELEAKKVSLEEEHLRSEEALADAAYSLDVAEETAFKISEATAAATAATAAAVEAEAHTPEAPLQPVDSSSPGSPVNPGTPETPSDKQTYVNLWAPRIDAYLAGSPMAGYGYAFASAAYDYNVDPRWSPAIACLESSKGRYCFLPYNAWGWGSVSWPNFETAIYSHVRGLSIGYGYTISESAAKKYCPPNWEYWYSFISNQMTLI